MQQQSITIQKVLNVEYPIDKAGKNIWVRENYLSENNETNNGHVTVNYDISRKNTKRRMPEALVYCDICFDELEGLHLSRELNTFDKMVYIAVGALYNAGNSIITTNQVYRVLGGKSKANAQDRQKIMDSMLKMAKTWIDFNDRHARKQFKKDDFFQYQGHLLEARFGERVTMNGVPVADAIAILAEPPMLAFAKHLKQYTTIKPQVFNLPLSNTDINLALKDYLLVNLPVMKKGRRNPKMLWTSLYDVCGATRNKDRVRKAVIKCLEYLMSDAGCRYIKGFSVQDDGVVVAY